MSWKHIIWDWNGTLLDDSHLCVRVLNELMEANGLAPIGLDAYRENFDFPVVRFYESLGFSLSPGDFEAISDRFISRYHELAHECALQPGADEVLAELDGAGVTNSILSAALHADLERAVDRHGVARFFTSLCGADDIYAHGKTEQGVRWLRAQDRWRPEEMVLVGDTRHDFEVAQSMGIDCLLVAHGHHTEERLAATGAPVFRSFEHLRVGLGPLLGAGFRA